MSVKEVHKLRGIIAPEEKEFAYFLSKFSRRKSFAFDLETFGEGEKGGLNPWSGNVRLIQIGLGEDVFVIDLGGTKDDRNEIHQSLEAVGFWKLLRKKLSDPEITVVGQNLKFDALFMKIQYELDIRGFRDTMLASQLLWAGIKQIRHSLGAICQRVLNIELDKTEQASDWGGELSSSQIEYAIADVKIMGKLLPALETRLEKSGLTKQFLIECNALPTFVEMEYHGMAVDTKLLEEAITQYESAAVKILEPFSTRFPGVRPTAQAKTLAPLFEEAFGLKLTSVSAKDLSKHYDIPEIRSLSLWRSLKKSHDYLKGMKKYGFGGRVRGCYRQIAPQGFGRSTCGKGSTGGVNLQNPPNDSKLPPEIRELGLTSVRRCFAVPKSRKLLVADLSQAHARIACQGSKDKTLLGAYLENQDCHAITASALAKIRGLDPDWTPQNIKAWTKDSSHSNHDEAVLLRNVSKNVFYGSLNCQGSLTLMDTLRKGAGIEISQSEAQEAIRAWQQTYHDLYQFQRQIQREASKFNYSFFDESWGKVTALSGRSIFMKKYGGQVGITDCTAFYWTATEADVIKTAMHKIQTEFDQNTHWEAIICNCAHDELDIECSEGYAFEVASSVCNNLWGAMSLWVKDIPVTDSPDFMSIVCDSWSEK